MKQTISYKPFPTTSKFHQSNAFVRGIMGCYGSGKSVSCCMEIFTRAQEQRKSPDGIRRSRWAIVRNSYGELRSTTQKTWTDWFPESTFGPIRRGSGPDTHFLKIEDVELEIMFLALDREEDARKLLSLEITGCWINEAREVSWKIIEAALARVGRYPPKRLGGASWSGVIMDSNPPTVRHWWYQRFEVDKPEQWELFKQPSGLSPQAENIENLPIDYYKNMSSGMDELSIRAYIHGEYSFIRSGQPVFPSFKHSMHVTNVKIKPTSAPIVAGVDVGRSPGCVFIQEQPDGQIVVLSEITGSDISAVALADMIKVHVAKNYPHNEVEYYADPSFSAMSQTRDESVSDVLFNNGIYAVPASTNSIDLRLEAVRGLLQTMVMGKPALIIQKECELLIEGLVGGYHFKEVALGNGRFKDLPEKNQYSHVCDALQYAILGSGHDPRYGNEPARVPKVLGKFMG